MAIEDAIFCAVVDLTSLAINSIARKLGYSEVKTKKIETYLGWFVALSFVALLCFITFKYS